MESAGPLIGWPEWWGETPQYPPLPHAAAVSSFRCDIKEIGKGGGRENYDKCPDSLINIETFSGKPLQRGNIDKENVDTYVLACDEVGGRILLTARKVPRRLA